MPELTVDGSTQEFAAGTRLVKAIEALGVEIGHRCGGKARCTTCRCVFEAGEPDEMTRAEYDKLVAADLLGEARLSCQITLDRDMVLEVLMTRRSEGWPDTGPQPADEVEPAPETFPVAALEAADRV